MNPQFYAFRWITLLLTQEFELSSIMRIWDCLLSHPSGVQVGALGCLNYTPIVPTIDLKNIIDAGYATASLLRYVAMHQRQSLVRRFHIELEAPSALP